MRQPQFIRKALPTLHSARLVSNGKDANRDDYDHTIAYPPLLIYTAREKTKLDSIKRTHYREIKQTRTSKDANNGE